MGGAISMVVGCTHATLAEFLTHHSGLQFRKSLFRYTQVSKAGDFEGRKLNHAVQSKPMKTSLVLAATEGVLYVSDFQRACDYFVKKLGFEIEFAYGEPSYYGLVKRDRARLCIQLVCEPVFVGDIREREQLLSAAITVATTVEIEQLFQEFKAAGVDFFQILKTEPWGARDFIVLDPDGNLLLFAGPAD